MIIICINLPGSTIRAAEMREAWAPLGELLILPATRATGLQPERGLREGRDLVPGEVAARLSHNRAVRLVEQIGRPCCVIEDDALPLASFAWPETHRRGRTLLYWHGEQKFGAVASIVTPGTPQLGAGRAADWWPDGYPVFTLAEPIVRHGSPHLTTIQGRVHVAREYVGDD